MLTTEKIFPKIKEELNKAEAERLAAVKRSKPYLYFFYGIIGLYIVLVIVKPVAWAAGLFGIMFGIIPWIIKRSNETNKIKKYFQQTIFPKVINEMGPEFSYEPKGQIPEDTIKKGRLFESFNKLFCEDLITGKVEDKTFRYAELKLVKRSTRVNNDDVNKESTVFKGIFFMLDLKHSVPSAFYVYPAVIARFIEKISKSFLPGKMVELNHESFNKTYRVYTEDPETIAKILPDAMLDKFVAINQQLKDDGITKTFTRFSFVDQSVFVAIEAFQGIMNPGLKKELNTEEFIKPQLQLINRMNELAQII